MPRTRTKPSDQDDRREQVVRATCRVIARDGLDRTSLRAIAQELGSTTGVLTHYFRDKDALLAFVLEAIIGQLELGQLDMPQGAPTLAGVERVLQGALPQDEESETWWRVWLAFTLAALSNERQSVRHRALYARLRQLWTDLFSDMKSRGLLPGTINPGVEADLLLCLVDGVGVQALISPDVLTPDHQMAIIQAHLGRLARA